MDHRKENSENIKLEALFQYFATLCKSSHNAYVGKSNPEAQPVMSSQRAATHSTFHSSVMVGDKRQQRTYSLTGRGRVETEMMATMAKQIVISSVTI